MSEPIWTDKECKHWICQFFLNGFFLGFFLGMLLMSFLLGK